MSHLKRILFIFLFAFLCTSCEKELFDYRNKYLGSWQFEISLSREWFTSQRGFFDTTMTTSSSGQLKYGSSENRVLIQTGTYSVEFAIDRNGKVIPEKDMGMNYEESGQFIGKRALIYYYYHHAGASRSYQRTNIRGNKN
ncbi:MAG: hypothetical protein ACM3NR_02395 [Methanosarcina sp.]